RLDVAGLDHALGEEQVPGFEYFELRHHADVADRDRHGLQVRRRVDEDAGAHVEAAHIEAADVGAKLDYVAHAVLRTPQGAGGAGLGRVLGVVLETGAWAGGQVDQDVGAARPDALDHLAIERPVRAGLGGLRVAHVDVNDRGTGLGGIDRGLRDLLRGHRNRRILARRVRRPRDRAGNDDFALH